MRLSRRSEYGIRALVDLVRSEAATRVDDHPHPHPSPEPRLDVGQVRLAPLDPFAARAHAVTGPEAQAQLVHGPAQVRHELGRLSEQTLKIMRCTVRDGSGI